MPESPRLAGLTSIFLDIVFNRRQQNTPRRVFVFVHGALARYVRVLSHLSRQVAVGLAGRTHFRPQVPLGLARLGHSIPQVPLGLLSQSFQPPVTRGTDGTQPSQPPGTLGTVGPSK